MESDYRNVQALQIGNVVGPFSLRKNDDVQNATRLCRVLH
jgi:hypothetical protein